MLKMKEEEDNREITEVDDSRDVIEVRPSIYPEMIIRMNNSYLHYRKAGKRKIVKREKTF